MLLQGGDFIMVTAPHFRNWNEMKWSIRYFHSAKSFNHSPGFLSICVSVSHFMIFFDLFSVLFGQRKYKQGAERSGWEAPAEFFFFFALWVIKLFDWQQSAKRRTRTPIGRSALYNLLLFPSCAQAERFTSPNSDAVRRTRGARQGCEPEETCVRWTLPKPEHAARFFFTHQLSFSLYCSFISGSLSEFFFMQWVLKRAWAAFELHLHFPIVAKEEKMISASESVWRMIRLAVTVALISACAASEYEYLSWKSDMYNGGRSYGKPPQCVDIPEDLRLCHNVGYNQMLLPNVLEHETMAEVKQQASSWVPLVHKNCHPGTQVFLCSLFAPVCLERPIFPCRWLCEAVRDGCTPIMEAFGFPWPEMLTCDKFPQDDVCIAMTQPNATEATMPTGNSHICVTDGFIHVRVVIKGASCEYLQY